MSGVWSVRLVDVVLSRVGETVKKQVDAEKKQTPCTATVGSLLLGRRRVVKSKDCHTGCDECHNAVLIERVLAAEESNVQSHDREKLARLGEDEGDVIDVLERCIAKRRSQGRCDGHQEHGEDDSAAGKDGQIIGLLARE